MKLKNMNGISFFSSRVNRLHLMKITVQTFFFLCIPKICGQDSGLTLHFSLEQCVSMATDSSLQSFKAKNLYLSSYWGYRTYKAGRLPSVSLNLSPVQYNSNFTKRYDYSENIEVFRLQQTLSSSGGLSVSQNLEPTGGSLTLSSSLDYMRNFGETVRMQYSSVPVRLGYSQSLFGFNRFKWEKRIEPLKYEKACRQLLYTLEEISETASGYFFDLAMSEAEYAMAAENVLSADSLLLAGRERDRISTISQSDLLVLELDLVNAENALENATTRLQESRFRFLSFYSLPRGSRIELVIPEIPVEVNIPAEEALALMRSNNPDILSYRQQMLESEQEVERTKKTAGFDASLSASIGFNQAGETFADAYASPSRQSIAGVSVTVPLLDRGIRRGRANMARNNLKVTRLTVEQNEQSLEQEVITAIAEFNKQQRLSVRTLNALDLAITSYNINKQRFIVEKTDVNTLTLSLNRRMEAQRNYLATLNRYWKCHYTIRKLTLHDFCKHENIDFQFEKLIHDEL